MGKPWPPNANFGGYPSAMAKPAVGQEGCFFLVRHPAADFFVLIASDVMVLKSDKEYDQVVAKCRVAARATADPVAALRAQVAEERFLAAATAVVRKSRMTADRIKDKDVEDLPADTNKLTLGVLIEMPWGRKTYTSDRLGGPNLTRQVLWQYTGALAFGYKEPHAPPALPGVSPPDISKGGTSRLPPF